MIPSGNDRRSFDSFGNPEGVDLLRLLMCVGRAGSFELGSAMLEGSYVGKASLLQVRFFWDFGVKNAINDIIRCVSPVFILNRDLAGTVRRVRECERERENFLGQ